jgi:hypothetical protein
MSYFLADVARLKRQVLAAIPEARSETWRDFGFALDVFVGDRHVIACQPGIDETDQREVFREVAEIKRLLELH